MHGAKSDEIQSLAAEWLTTAHGFRSEVVDAFKDGTRLRPDFIGDLGGMRGILVEVERGGAVTNNHDLKDLWKCHLCDRTQHLFLLVPHANWSEAGEVRERPFKRSSTRLRSFFDDPRAYVDVLSAWVIGYGYYEPVAPADAAASTAADYLEAIVAD